MELYLQGQDLWEIVGGSKTIPPTRENADKAMFVLKITVQKELLDHIQESNTRKEASDTLHEITKLDPESWISETRMRRIIIRCLRPECNGFMTAIRGWQTTNSSGIQKFAGKPRDVG
ncbi:hypothetical protein AMTRI_Chr11g155950 [Amborella trichopoda]